MAACGILRKVAASLLQTRSRPRRPAIGRRVGCNLLGGWAGGTLLIGSRFAAEPAAAGARGPALPGPARRLLLALSKPAPPEPARARRIPWAAQSDIDGHRARRGKPPRCGERSASLSACTRIYAAFEYFCSFVATTTAHCLLLFGGLPRAAPTAAVLVATTAAFRSSSR